MNRFAALLAVSLLSCTLSTDPTATSVCEANSRVVCVYTGPAGTEGVGTCRAGTKTCDAHGSAFGACTGELLPAVSDDCATPFDEDCDGFVNAACPCDAGATSACYAGPESTEGVGACRSGFQVCSDDGSSLGPCQGSVLPQQDDDCTTPFDDDCDGQVNEAGAGCICAPGTAAPCYSGPTGTSGVGTCHDGIQFCNADGLGYGPCASEILPIPEDCASATDDDCDGQANQGCLCIPGAAYSCYGGPAGTQGVGICAAGLQACNPDGLGFGECVGEVGPTSEICVDVSDDDEDCDGVACGALLWSRCAGDGGQQGVQGLVVDSAGNVVVTGYFGGSADFGGGSLSSAGGIDAFVAKFDSSGSHLWSVRFGGSGSDEGRGAAVDAAGNIFVTGYFNQNIDFGGGTLVSAGMGDVFLVKLTPAGSHVWSKRFGDASDQIGDAVAVDGVSANVAITGFFKGTVNFGGSTLASTGSDDVFVAQFDGSGTHGWSKRFGDTGVDLGDAVAMDAAGNVVVTGNFTGTVDFGGGGLQGAGSGDVFVAKYDTSGAHIWSKRFGGAGSEQCSAVVTDGGDVLLTGRFATAIDFGGGPIAASAGGTDTFLTRLDSTGAHVWSKGFGDPNGQEGFGIAVDSLSNVVFTGYISAGDVDFGGGALSSHGARDIFLAKFNKWGTHLWSGTLGSSNLIQNDYGRAVGVDASGSIFLAGEVYQDIGQPFSIGAPSCGGAFDAYVARFAP